MTMQVWCPFARPFLFGDDQLCSDCAGMAAFGERVFLFGGIHWDATGGRARPIDQFWTFNPAVPEPSLCHADGLGLQLGRAGEATSFEITLYGSL